MRSDKIEVIPIFKQIFTQDFHLRSKVNTSVKCFSGIPVFIGVTMIPVKWENLHETIKLNSTIFQLFNCRIKFHTENQLKYFTR